MREERKEERKRAGGENSNGNNGMRMGQKSKGGLRR